LPLFLLPFFSTSKFDGFFGLSKQRGKSCLTETALRNYNVLMKTRIVKIGNSLGVRIPKVLLEQSRLAEEVDIEAFDRRIVIRAAQQPRDDWDAAFQAMAENGDDKLLDAEANNSSGWDETEWQW
jgi:antitoxin MazE